MERTKLYLIIILLLVTSCKREDTDNIEKIESGIQDKVVRLVESNKKLQKEIDDYKNKIDSLNQLNQIQIGDNVILVVRNWIEGRDRLINSAFVFYQTIDSIYLPSYNSFPAYEEFRALLRNKRFVYVYYGGEKSGLLEFEDYGIDFQDIRLTGQILPESLKQGYTDGSQKFIYMYNSIGTTSSLPNLDVVRNYPTKDNFRIFVDETSKEFKNIVGKPFNQDSIKIEKLDVINSSETNESTIIGSCNLIFELQKNDKIDMYHLFMILNIDSNSKVHVGYKYSIHIKSFYEGYGETKYFIDIYDIDSDGIYEIFVVDTGYEKESVLVLKKVNEKWIEFKKVQSYYGG